MPESVESRVAALTQRVEDLAGVIEEVRMATREDHHRLRNVESAVSRMIDAQKAAREGEREQYRRLGIRMQVLTLVLAAAAVVVPIVVAILATR